MKALVILLVLGISRLTTSGLIPYHGVTIGINANSGPVHSSYFHEQDHYGQYVYGYTSKYHAKDEIKTADGVTRGGYSYIDANGILQTVQYISDPVNGFRVSASNIPRDLPEVALAKAQHYHAYENIRREHAILAAQLAENNPIPLSPIPVENSYIAPVHTAQVLPVPTEIEPIPYVPKEVHYIPVPVSSQHHAQDGHGQYSYGYAGPLSSKTEIKTADGVTRGGYSYIDANGILQSVQYISDPVNGFRVQATNLPEAPQVTLVGPKVTTSVVAPRDNHAVISQNHNIPLVEVPDSQPLASETYVNPVILAKSPGDLVFNSPETSQKIHSIPFRANGRILTQDYPPNANIPHGQVVRNTEILQDNENVASSHNIPVYQRPGQQYTPQYSSGSFPPQSQNVPISNPPSYAQNQRVLVSQGNVGTPVLSGQPPHGAFGGLNLAQEGYEQPNLQVYRDGPQVGQGPLHPAPVLATPSPESVRINLQGGNYAPSVTPLHESHPGASSYQEGPVPVPDPRLSQVLSQVQPQGAPQGEIIRQQVLNQGVPHGGRVQLEAQALGELNLQADNTPVHFSPSPNPNVYQGVPGGPPSSGHVVVTARPEFVPHNPSGAGQAPIQFAPQPSQSELYPGANQGHPGSGHVVLTGRRDFVPQHQNGGQVPINFAPQPAQEGVYQGAIQSNPGAGPILVTARPGYAPSSVNGAPLHDGVPNGNAVPVNYSPRPIPEGIYPGQNQGGSPVLVSPRPENRFVYQPEGNPNYSPAGNPGAAVNYATRPVYQGSPQPNLAPGPVPVPNGNVAQNPALFAPDQAKAQPVEERVNSVSIGELDLKDANIFEEASPDDLNDPNVSIGNGYIIRGPTHNPNKQSSGFFNQTLYY